MARKPGFREQLFLDLHEKWYGLLRIRLIVVAASIAVYALTIVCLAPRLGVAVNYIVILPVIVASFAFGLVGGIVSGTLALLMNNSLLILIGLPQFMPENHPVAEIAGIAVGTSMGFLGMHYRRLGREILRRRESEERLRTALADRMLLLRELNHRVKNNLNVIHSLIGLQSGEIADAHCRELLRDLSRRIGSMAFVHDRLNDTPHVGVLQYRRYLPPLVEHILGSYSIDVVDVDFHFDEGLPDIGLSRATSLGLLVNEVIVNALKHAFADIPEPRLLIRAALSNEGVEIIIADNGSGFDPDRVNRGLGFRLIDALVRQLDGRYRYRFEAGTAFLLDLPAETDAVLP